MHYGQLFRLWNTCYFLNIRRFWIEQFCCGSKVVLHVFERFYFLTQIDDFARAVAHALSQIFAIQRHLLFF